MNYYYRLVCSLIVFGTFVSLARAQTLLISTTKFNPTIEVAQQALRDAGYTVGAIDGLPGPSTKKAISKYQRDKGIPETGNIDVRTAASLLIPIYELPPDLSVVFKGISIFTADGGRTIVSATVSGLTCGDGNEISLTDTNIMDGYIKTRDFGAIRINYVVIPGRGERLQYWVTAEQKVELLKSCRP